MSVEPAKQAASKAWRVSHRKFEENIAQAREAGDRGKL